jgi:hypothetical protein
MALKKMRVHRADTITVQVRPEDTTRYEQSFNAQRKLPYKYEKEARRGEDNDWVKGK